MTKKVLLIEDEQVQIEVMMRALEKQFKVFHAPKGEEGLELALEENPDFIILDLFLPGMKGQEVIKKLRENPKTVEIPVLVLTHLEDEDTKHEIEKLEKIEYLRKEDYQPEEIVDKVKEKLA